jgi:hypothetical protein
LWFLSDQGATDIRCFIKEVEYVAEMEDFLINKGRQATKKSIYQVVRSGELNGKPDLNIQEKS